MTKDQFQASRPPLPSRSAGRNPSLLAFGLFGLFYAFTFFSTFFAAAKGSFWQNVGYLSAFGLYETFPNFSSFLGSYKLVRAQKVCCRVADVRLLSSWHIRKTEISLMSYCVLIALKPKFSLIHCGHFKMLTIISC